MESVAKKYRVLKSLGQGAMGEVFLVLPPRGEPVALKLLKSLDEKAGRNATEQFENEFKVLKRLSHPNIGRIYDYGYDETLKKVFFTMPWLKGNDIYAATKELSFEQCEDFFIQTLRALNYLHQKNLIHCDLKPGNVYIEDGRALLIDFGLAGYWGDFIVGTPTYLAPEIYQGGRHNVASDLYAMGVIFYNCLTRTQPFSGKTLEDVFNRHKTLTPPPIHEINKKVPKYFGDIVATLLNKKPSDRFPNAAAVIEEIDAFSKKKYPIETEETLLSYLPTQSELIGRKEILLDIQTGMNDFLAHETTVPYHVILIHGRQNVGKSKVVNKIINDLQLAKISVEKALPPFQDNDNQILMAAHAIVFENIDTYLRSQEERSNLREFTTLIEQKVITPETARFLLIATSGHEYNFDEIRKIFPEEATQFTTVELLPYTKEETKEFLTTIIGQKEIPQTFLDQFYRNTEGLPDIAAELIQGMIAKGLLFDNSGRWNEDLLAELDKAFDRLEVSESLEQEFEKTYAALNQTEEEIVNWLSLCPHALSTVQLDKLTNAGNLKPVLDSMAAKNILRQESGHYSLYRQIFQNFVQQNLPDKDVKRRHTRLALPQTGLDQKWAIYHLSLGVDAGLALRAAEKLAVLYEKDGERDSAVDVYKRLIKNNVDQSIEKRLQWVIEVSTLLIWLDRFKEAIELMDTMEKEMQQAKVNVDFGRFLLFLEKKGLALLQIHELDRARLYFKNGLRSAEKDQKHLVHCLRFENDLAQIEIILGNHDKAIEIFKDTRDRAKDIRPEELEKLTNNDLGHVYVQRREFDKCLPILSQDMKNFSTMRNQEPLARVLYSFALAHQNQKDHDKAIRAYEECVRICKRGHFLPLLMRAYNGLGNIYFSLKDFEPALMNYQKALELSVRLQDTTAKAAMLFNQGKIHRDQNNFALATRRFLLVLQVLENKEKKVPFDFTMLTNCYNGLANVSDKENNSLKALGYLLERLRISQQIQMSRAEKFIIHLDLAEMYLKTRLKDQFQKIIPEVEALAETDEHKEKIAKMKQEWLAVENFNEQESTGRIKMLQD